MSEPDFRAVVDSLNRRPSASLPEAKNIETVAVMGAGPVGQLLACEALAAGTNVRLHSVFGRELEPLANAGSISVRGEHLVGSYPVAESERKGSHIVLSPNVDVAVDGADLIFVSTPVSAHSTYAGCLAGCLTDEQLVVLVPGGFLGALQFKSALRLHACAAKPSVSEVATSPYLASKDKSWLRVHAVAAEVECSSLPVTSTHEVTASIQQVLPMLKPVDSPLRTAFTTILDMLPVAPLITNTAAVDKPVEPGSEPLLADLITPSLSNSLLRQADDERRIVAFYYGERQLESSADWLRRTFSQSDESESDDIALAIRSLEAFDELRIATEWGPEVNDAVLNTLVPIASAGSAAGVPTPAIDVIVQLAAILTGIDFAREGRSIERMGLEHIRPSELHRALAEDVWESESTPGWRVI